MYEYMTLHKNLNAYLNASLPESAPPSTAIITLSVKRDYHHISHVVRLKSLTTFSNAFTY